MTEFNPEVFTPSIQFKKADHYLFFYEDTQLLLLTWERDFTKALYLVLDQAEDGTFILDYPGTLFTERLMEVVDAIFFIQVTEQANEQSVATKYALGAYFQTGEDWYGAYYPRTKEAMAGNIPEIVFFRAVDNGEAIQLEEIEVEEHQTVAQAFLDKYGDLLQIKKQA